MTKTKKPLEPNYNAAFFGNLFGVTERRVQQLAKQGVIPKASRGKYPLIGTVKGYVGFLQQRGLSAAPAPQADDLDPVQEKARLDKERRLAQELQNAQKKGELFPIEAAQYVFAKMGAEIAAILDGLPAKIKRRLPKVTGHQMNLVRKEIVKARRAAVGVSVLFNQFLDEYLVKKGIDKE